MKKETLRDRKADLEKQKHEKRGRRQRTLSGENHIVTGDEGKTFEEMMKRVGTYTKKEKERERERGRKIDKDGSEPVKKSPTLIG